MGGFCKFVREWKMYNSVSRKLKTFRDHLGAPDEGGSLQIKNASFCEIGRRCRNGFQYFETRCGLLGTK